MDEVIPIDLQGATPEEAVVLHQIKNRIQDEFPPEVYARLKAKGLVEFHPSARMKGRPVLELTAKGQQVVAG
jgi:hypothetical protein